MKNFIFKKRLPIILIFLSIFGFKSIAGMISKEKESDTSSSLFLEDRPRVITQVEATRTVAPNLFTFDLLIEIQNKEKSILLESHEARMGQIRTLLKKHEIKSDSLVSTSYNLGKWMVYENGHSINKGFQLQHRLNLKVEELELFKKVLASFSDLSDIQIESLMQSLRPETRAQYEKELLKEAITSGEAKVRMMVESLGKKFLGVFKVEDQSSFSLMGGSPISPYRPSNFSLMKGGSVESTSLQGAKVVVEVRVRIEGVYDWN